MGEMRNEAEAAKLVPHVSLREITTNPTLRIPLVISMMMMIAQQLSGINAVSIGWGVMVDGGEGEGGEGILSSPSLVF